MIGEPLVEDTLIEDTLVEEDQTGACHRQERGLLRAVRVLILEQSGGIDILGKYLGHWRLCFDICVKL